MVIVGIVSGTNRPLSVASPPKTTSSNDKPFCFPLVDLYLTEGIAFRTCVGRRYKISAFVDMIFLNCYCLGDDEVVGTLQKIVLRGAIPPFLYGKPGIPVPTYFGHINTRLLCVIPLISPQIRYLCAELYKC